MPIYAPLLHRLDIRPLIEPPGRLYLHRSNATLHGDLNHCHPRAHNKDGHSESQEMEKFLYAEVSSGKGTETNQTR